MLFVRQAGWRTYERMHAIISHRSNSMNTTEVKKKRGRHRWGRRSKKNSEGMKPETRVPPEARLLQCHPPVKTHSGLPFIRLLHIVGVGGISDPHGPGLWHQHDQDNVRIAAPAVRGLTVSTNPTRAH